MIPPEKVEELVGTRIARTDLNILTYDIERLPGYARVWGPKTTYIQPSAFASWPSTLTIAARWYDDPRPIFLAEWQEGHEAMLAKAWDLFERADIVVGFNSISFDNRHLRSDWLSYDMGLPSPWRDIDLLRGLRKHFGFESKSLDMVTRRLGREGKVLHYNMDLAEAAAQGDVAAQLTLQDYNQGDVELTEWLYDRMRGYVPEWPAINLGDGISCPYCGSVDDLEEQLTGYQAIVMEYPKLRCMNCWGNSRGNWSPVRTVNVRGV